MRSRLNIAVFAVVLIALAAIVTVFPRDLRTIEIENRNFNILELTPENIFGGGFDKDFEAYVSDRVGYRSDFVKVASGFEKLYGLPSPGGARIVDGIFSQSDGLAEIFEFDAVAAADYTAALNAFRAELGEDVKIYSLILPTRMEFMPQRYKNVADSERDAIRAIHAGLSDGITAVDAYSALEAHSDEYIYFRTDHHWTALGAYYAYRSLAEAAGYAPLELDAYDRERADGFLGYLYNFAPSASVADFPDSIEYFTYKGELTTSVNMLRPPAEGEKATYGLFLGGDYPKLEIDTSVKNGKTAVIIKDSYANCLVPWLAPHYEKLVLLDPRTFEGSATQKIGEYENVDLIFVNYVFSTSFPDFVEYMDDMR